ncbi:phage integrase N-terminal SAM-like domain-containing protein, partial [Klebsiella pneumoniae]|uniref:phage integrase N-terminal SAM-like domain-containing protein n=1 Tax=Klebsiella pneumoniae TaxID=573 RepID=UPI0038CC030A
IDIGPMPGGLKSTEDVGKAFEAAALKAGLARNTRRTYAGAIEEFSRLLKAGQISGPQGYFDYLATVKKLAPNTVWHALNPLKFLYEKVLWKE